MRFFCALCRKAQKQLLKSSLQRGIDVLLCFVVLAVCELLFLYSAEPLRRTSASDRRDISHQIILRRMESCQVDRLWRRSKSDRFKELNVSSERIRRARGLRAAGRQVSLKNWIQTNGGKWMSMCCWRRLAFSSADCRWIGQTCLQQSQSWTRGCFYCWHIASVVTRNILFVMWRKCNVRSGS